MATQKSSNKGSTSRGKSGSAAESRSKHGGQQSGGRSQQSRHGRESEQRSSRANAPNGRGKPPGTSQRAAGQSKDEGMMQKTSRGLRDASSTVADSVKQHPVAASLLGAGITAGAALLVARATGFGPWKPQDQQQGEQQKPGQSGEEEQPQMQEDQQSDEDDSGRPQAESQDQGEEDQGESDQSEADDQGGLLGRARQTYESVKGRVSETVGGKAREGLHYSKEKIGSLWHDHPLAVGLGILAAGVAAGMMLPSSNAEKRLVGGKFADRVKSTGRELLDQGKEMAGNIFKETGEALGEEMEREGLTPDKLGKKVKRIAGRIKDVVSDAVEGD
jgi:hypothetical protein